MADSSGIEQVVRSAWERRLLVVIVERSALAAAAVLGALVLMLLVGTQILDARWLILLAVIGLGIAGYQVRQRLLGHYRVAQILDHRLQLADSLSTAWFLLNEKAKAPAALAEFQLRGAQQAAQSVNVAEAFPFTGQKLWSIAGVLALAAASLFSLRYFVTHSLSLEHSLIPFQLSEVFERSAADSSEGKREREKDPASDEAHSQKKSPQSNAKKDAQDQQKAEPPPPMGNAPGAEGQNPNQPAEMREAKQGSDDQSKQSGASGASQQQQAAGEKQGEDGEKNDAGQKSASDDPANNPKSSEGLLDKMKDAISSLAAKMKPSNQGNQQAKEKQSGQQPTGEQQNGSQEKDSGQQASSNMQASEQAQASQGQAQGQTQEKNKAGQGKASDQASSKNSSESHSGVGSQDGDKEMKNAEQLKAAGKLAEIIGQRSATATGDIMVENSSGKQRLQTDYSQRMGRHADLGGEINRDEVPLIYQQYVREYMSQVRKQAKGHKPASAAHAQER